MVSIAHVDFANRVRQIMAARGLNQEALAALVGTRQSMISRWLNGSWPGAPYLPPLADALEVTPYYLLTGREQASATVPPLDMGVAAPLVGAQAVRPRAPAAKRGRRAG